MNIKGAKKPEKSGMEPIPDWKEPCRNPSHQPPNMICIPAGQQYRHVCPGCGKVAILRGSNVTL